MEKIITFSRCFYYYVYNTRYTILLVSELHPRTERIARKDVSTVSNGRPRKIDTTTDMIISNGLCIFVHTQDLAAKNQHAYE